MEKNFVVKDFIDYATVEDAYKQSHAKENKYNDKSN